MKDFVSLGNGDSRYMKSAISADATWEQFRDMLRNGTFAFDLNGINPAGIAEQGTSLSKDNLLSDETAEMLGFQPDDDPTVNDAFQRTDKRIKNSVSTFQKLMTGRLI